MVVAYLAGIITVAIVAVSAMAIYSYFSLRKISKKLKNFYSKVDQNYEDIHRTIYSESKDLKNEIDNVRSYVDQANSKITKSQK